MRNIRLNILTLDVDLMAARKQKGNKDPLISVIIPFRNNVEQVEDCIKSLKTQKYKNIEMILVSDVVKWKDRDKRIKAVHDPKFRGVGEKRNAGVKLAKGDIYFFLDSDCTVKPDIFTNLIEIFDETSADAVSGKTLAPQHSNLLGMATGLEYEDRFNRMGEDFVTVAATTCFAVKSGPFKTIGGFKDYSTGEATGEDWDFSRKFTKAGFKLFHTNTVRVHHNHKADSIKKWFNRRVQHCEYRITHKRRYNQVFEEYFSPGMFIDTTIFLSIPVALRMYNQSGRWEVLTLPIYAILRNVAWFAGTIKGLMKPVGRSL